MVNFFSTIQKVLNSGLASVCRAQRIDEDEAIKAVRKYLNKNSSAYFSDGEQVEYSNPLCRLAYLYCYVGAHANLVDNSFYIANKVLAKFFLNLVRTKQEIHICSLGGGPGSELLGIVKFFERSRKEGEYVDIHFTLIDVIKEWDESWNSLIDGLESTYKEVYGPNRRKWPTVIHRSFLPCDLTVIDELKHLVNRFEKTNLFILNHAVSEFYKNPGFKNVIKHLIDSSSDDCVFLIIDRRQDAVIDFVKDIIKSLNLKKIGENQEETNMDTDEQKSQLGDWQTKMGRPPKVSWNVFYGIFKKQP